MLKKMMNSMGHESYVVMGLHYFLPGAAYHACLHADTVYEHEKGSTFREIDIALRAGNGHLVESITNGVIENTKSRFWYTTGATIANTGVALGLMGIAGFFN